MNGQQKLPFPNPTNINGFESRIYPAFAAIGINSDELIFSSHNSGFTNSVSFTLPNMNKEKFFNLLNSYNKNLNDVFSKIGKVYLSDIGNNMLDIRVDSHPFN
jgi:hypothetical protein